MTISSPTSELHSYRAHPLTGLRAWPSEAELPSDALHRSERLSDTEIDSDEDFFMAIINEVRGSTLATFHADVGDPDDVARLQEAAADEGVSLADRPPFTGPASAKVLRALLQLEAAIVRIYIGGTERVYIHDSTDDCVLLMLTESELARVRQMLAARGWPSD